MAIESRTSKNFSDFMRMNSHNTDNLMNDYDWEDVVRSKRIVSLDSSAYKKQKAAKRSQGTSMFNIFLIDNSLPYRDFLVYLKQAHSMRMKRKEACLRITSPLKKIR